MKKDYLAEKEKNVKSANQVMVFLVIFIILFSMVLFRVALRSGWKDIFSNSMPSDKDAFEIAKDYIKPVVSPSGIQFADENFQCYKRADSVYIIKSSFVAKASAGKNNFTITLKYHGGGKLNDRNWTVMSLIEDQ